MEIFNQISADDFFQNYWQKKPLLIKNAIPNFESPLDADELAGLACEEEVESRLILEIGGQKPWEVTSGPISEEVLTSLPETNWSLAIQGVDRLIPEVSKLLSHFKFLPNWLLDDIMTSYAPDKGSVGAHIDNYDVFIIQAQGRRRWFLGGEPEYNEKYQEGLDIRLLEKFEPVYEWDVESGDVLYIPTRFAHHGVAIGECLNYSVGFRAPTDIELVNSLASWSLDKEVPEKFFSDPNIEQQESPGEITDKSLNALAQHIKDFIDSPNFKLWFGEHISEPKTYLQQQEEDTQLTDEQLLAELRNGEVLLPAEGLKRCWIRSTESLLFIEGERVNVSKPLNPEICALLCDAEEIGIANVSDDVEVAKVLLELLTTLYNRGHVLFQEKD